MAHYAFLDENNIVLDVFAGIDENTDNIDWEKWYSDFHGKRCLRTSVNTKGNTHAQNKQPFRKNFAGIGMFYDEEKDAFLFQKPFESWILNENTFLWDPPILKPEGRWKWDEESVSWVEDPPQES